MFMIAKLARMLFSILIFLPALPNIAIAETPENPCGGPSALLSIINRPTVGDSACVVPLKKIVVETGTQYQQLLGQGSQINIPEAVFRLGLPADTEFVFILPNFIHQTIAPYSGFTTSAIGLKHEVGYAKNWVASAEAYFIIPGGSAAFGSHGAGAVVSAIVNYIPKPAWSFTFLLSAVTQTESSSAGGGRFNSLNPDLVLSYSATEILNFYAEVYGQSKVAPGEGSGFNADAGLIYLPRPDIAVDIELGQRLSGNLYGFSHYLGAGLSLLF
jgi:hypothetical protein